MASRTVGGPGRGMAGGGLDQDLQRIRRFIAAATRRERALLLLLPAGLLLVVPVSSGGATADEPGPLDLAVTA